MQCAQAIDELKSYFEELRNLQASLVDLPVYLVDECRRIVCRSLLVPVEAGMPSGRKGKRMPTGERDVEVVLLTDFLLILESTVTQDSPEAAPPEGDMGK